MNKLKSNAGAFLRSICRLTILASLVMMLSSNYGYSQIYAEQKGLPVDEITKKVSYSDIVQLKKTKDELFLNAKIWLAKSFNDYKSVVKLEDQNNGIIIIKANYVKGDVVIKYEITISVKLNKYKIVISNIEASYSSQYLPVENQSIEKIIQEYKSMNEMKSIIDHDPQMKSSYAKNEYDNLDINILSRTLIIRYTDEACTSLVSSFKNAMNNDNKF